MILIPKYNNIVECDGSLSIVKSNGGSIVEEIYVPNLVTNIGKEYIAGRMIANTRPIMNYMALGTSNTNSTSLTVTALGAEITAAGYQRQLATLTQVGGVGGAADPRDAIQYVATFGENIPSSSATLYEAGIFDTATSLQGNMLCRTTFPIVTKEAGDTITITWTITIN